jgi:hypothetical protein
MVVLTEDGHEFRKRRRVKNVALAIGLFALVVLFYFISIIRMSGGSGT